MKARDQVARDALRVALAEVETIEARGFWVTDLEVASVIRDQIQEAKETLSFDPKPEAAAALRREIQILAATLPAKDELFDQIVAAPDDDAPRLVWADREGGLQGELVVIQCAIAKDGHPKGELARLYAREKELLTELRVPAHVTFVRGFIEHAVLRNEQLEEAERVFQHYPLLRSVRLASATRQRDNRNRPLAEDFALILPALRRLDTIVMEPSHYTAQPSEYVAALGELGLALRALRVPTAVPDATIFAPFATLEELELVLASRAEPAFGLFAQHPRLKRLTITKEWRFAEGELAALFREPAQLEALTLGNHADDELVEMLAHASFASSLKRLRLGRVPASDRALEFLASAFPSLERLEFHETSNPIARLEAAIPFVSYGRIV